ncbi:MAG: mobile mystery protein A [Gammaproteobacteria bacterium]
MKYNSLFYKKLKFLDQGFAPWKRLPATQPPSTGWLKAVRTALGMTIDQMAERLGQTRQSVIGFEKREAEGTITLKTLREAAAALDCDLVYALVPRDSLDTRVKQRARKLAVDRIARIEHSMRLEDQAPRPQSIDALVQTNADEILRGSPRRLWDQT